MLFDVGVSVPARVEVVSLIQRRKSGARVGRQAQTIPMKGSQQLQMKSLPIAQVRSGEVMTVWIVVMRTMEAMQTLWLMLVGSLFWNVGS